jgi:hypothetical protein
MTMACSTGSGVAQRGQARLAEHFLLPWLTSTSRPIAELRKLRYMIRGPGACSEAPTMAIDLA